MGLAYPASSPLDGEAEQQHVAVPDLIIAAFLAHFAGVLGRLFTAEADEIVVENGLGADEDGDAAKG